jgi:long-chain acyl-CoA synthetase
VSDTPYPVTKLLQMARDRGDEVWLRQPVAGEERTWTWAQAADEVGRMATALRAKDLATGSTIAISGRNTAHWVMADLAISMAGLVSVGLYPKQASSAVSYIMDHAACRAVFVGPMPDIDQFIDALPDGVETMALPYPGVPACDTTWDELTAAHEPMREYGPPDEDELATLVYTSGSTGDPKGVMITYGNALFAAHGFISALPGEGKERLFSYLPLAHVFERVVVGLGSLYYEAEVYFLEDLGTLADELAAYAPTRFYGVPLVYGRIQKGVIEKVGADRLRLMTSIPIVRGFVRGKILEGAGLQNARTLVSGSAPLPLPVLEWFDQALGVEILQGYSLSETTLYATANLPRGEPDRLRRTGPPRGRDQAHRRGRDRHAPRRDHEGVLQGRGEDPRGVHRRRLLPHRRPRDDRRRRLRVDHRPGQGDLQDAEGQVRRPGTDRGRDAA